MFEVSAKAIDKAAWSKRLDNPKAGSTVVFEGLVRNHNEGLSVTALEYECFEDLAYLEAEKILAEAKAKFKVYDIFCVHRTGRLEIGELAVWIGVASAHRQAAFAACQYMIDALKIRLPIWKKEHYLDQAAVWVNCQQCASHAHDQHAELAFTAQHYYRRQSSLPELGQQGQDKLSAAKVLVVGAGGLGCPALAYLAAAGIGTLGICDGDLVEVSNLHRQVLYQFSDIGLYKADRAAEYLQAANPFIDVRIHREHIDCENAERLLDDYDLVLDCTDNFASKFLIHDACFLTQTPLVQASIYQFEGQLQVYTFAEHEPCLRCIWPQQPEADCVGSCAEAGVLGVVPGVLGSWQATEALKYLLHLPGLAVSETVMINLLSNEIFKLKQEKNTDCPLCGAQASIKAIQAANYQVQSEASARNPAWQRTAQDLTGSGFVLIDIRSSSERALSEDWQMSIKHVPADELDALISLQPECDYLLVCHKGQRSYQWTEILRALGHERVYSLSSGMESLKPYLKAHAPSKGLSVGV